MILVNQSSNLFSIYRRNLQILLIVIVQVGGTAIIVTLSLKLSKIMRSLNGRPWHYWHYQMTRYNYYFLLKIEGQTRHFSRFKNQILKGDSALYFAQCSLRLLPLAFCFDHHHSRLPTSTADHVKYPFTPHKILHHLPPSLPTIYISQKRDIQRSEEKNVQVTIYI